MQTKPFLMIAALASFSATTAFAQSQAAPAPDAAPPAAAAPEAMAQPAEPAAQPTNVPAQAADLQPKSSVYDAAGAKVGTILSVTSGGAVVSTGTAKAELPIASFAKNAQGLVIGMTKAQLEAAVAKATPAKS